MKDLISWKAWRWELEGSKSFWVCLYGIGGWGVLEVVRPIYPVFRALGHEGVKTAEERVGSGDPMDVVGSKMRSWRVEGLYLYYLPLLASGSLFNLFQGFLRWCFGQVLSMQLPLANTQLWKGWRAWVCWAFAKRDVRVCVPEQGSRSCGVCALEGPWWAADPSPCCKPAIQCQESVQGPDF